MADVKNESAAEKLVVEAAPEAVKPQPKPAAKRKKSPVKATPAKQEDFCVYLGPSVRGVITRGAVYPGTREEVLARLERAISLYPGIAGLVVPSTTFPTDRTRVKKEGTLLHNRYRQMALKIKKP